MRQFKQYNRVAKAEARPVTYEEVEVGSDALVKQGISVSDEDLLNGSPIEGDMIGRNPKNHKDQWLIAAAYFADNFEGI